MSVDVHLVCEESGLTTANQHNAADAALGFLYQGQYALILLWDEIDDDAVIYVEALDDVVLVAKGETLLEQLKHSLQTVPPSITIASVQLWKSLRVWINALKQVDLPHTWFHLISVADVASASPLNALLVNKPTGGISDLRMALAEEAKRVRNERNAAKADGKKPLPHSERAKACEAFLGLSDQERDGLLVLHVLDSAVNL